MKSYLRIILFLWSCLLVSRVTAAEIITADVCVYGGTAGGVAAAVEAARLGKTVVVAEFGSHLGGMSSGGLSQTDIGNKGAIGGISREFYRRMGRHYGKEEQWSFEPSVAKAIFFQMVNEAKVPVYFHQRLVSVKKRRRASLNSPWKTEKFFAHACSLTPPMKAI